MNKKILTYFEHRLVAACYQDNQMKSIELLKNNSILHNIYVAKVSNIVQNINVAFLDIGIEEKLYYSLDQNKDSIFLNPKKNQQVRIGDLLLVQIYKPAMKTKQPSATCYLSISGNLCVASYQKLGIGISAKIREDKKRAELTNLLSPYLTDTLGFVLRTASKDAASNEILNQAKEKKAELEEILAKAVNMKKGTLLYQAPNESIALLQEDSPLFVDEYCTDDEELFHAFHSFITSNPDKTQFTLNQIHLHKGELPLTKIYPLEKDIKTLLQPRVWLKSGGYLVIEPTEALTVIDVNTGKAIGKGKRDAFLYSLNEEAAKEIARQITLRNLSGIILVDFINMKSANEQKNLLYFLQEQLNQYPIKSNVIDITKLGLVEITRKKTKATFKEQWDNY